MNTKNTAGRNMAVGIGVYFVIKSVLNMILGGGFTGIIWAVIEAILLYTRLQYINYAIVILTGLVVIKNFGNNISNIGDNWIYLLEGIIDIGCCLILCVSAEVKEHFSNKWTEIGKN